MAIQLPGIQNPFAPQQKAMQGLGQTIQRGEERMIAEEKERFGRARQATLDESNLATADVNRQATQASTIKKKMDTATDLLLRTRDPEAAVSAYQSSYPDATEAELNMIRNSKVDPTGKVIVETDQGNIYAMQGPKGDISYQVIKPAASAVANAYGGTAGQVDLLTDDAVWDKAVYKTAGDEQRGKVTGGRAATAVNQRIENAAAALRRDLGMSDADKVTDPQEFVSRAKSYAKLRQRRDMASTFVRNMDKQFNQFQDLVERIRYENPAILNRPWQAFQNYVQGKGELGAYRALVTDISNEAAKLSSGAEASVAALTEGQADKWAGIHYEAMPTDEMLKLLDETVRIGKQRLDSFEDELAESKKKVGELVEIPRDNDYQVGGEFKGKKITRTGRNEAGNRVLLLEDGTTQEVRSR